MRLHLPLKLRTALLGSLLAFSPIFPSMGSTNLSGLFELEENIDASDWTGNYYTVISDAVIRGKEGDRLSMINGNQAFAFTPGSHLTLFDLQVITFNSLINSGSPVINASNSKIVFEQNESITFLNNESTQGKGGAILAKDLEFISNNNITIKDNSTQGNGGGGFCITNGLKMKDNDSIIFDSNYSKAYGGAISGSSQGGMEFINNNSILFKQNRSDSYAGALDISGNVHFTGNGSVIFEKNTAIGSGGAIYGNAVYFYEILSVLEFNANQNVSFIENQVTRDLMAYGGGIFLSRLEQNPRKVSLNLCNNTAVEFISNSVISTGNVANGGAIYSSAGDILIAGNSFVVFAGNIVKGKLDTQPRREAIYHSATEQRASIAANEGKSVEFYDGNTFMGKVTLNGHDGANDNVITTGTILFSGKSYNDIEAAGSGAISYFRNSLELKGGILAVEGQTHLEVSNADGVSTLTLHAGSTLSFGLEDYYKDQSFIITDKLSISDLGGVNLILNSKDYFNGCDFSFNILTVSNGGYVLPDVSLFSLTSNLSGRLFWNNNILTYINSDIENIGEGLTLTDDLVVQTWNDFRYYAEGNVTIQSQGETLYDFILGGQEGICGKGIMAKSGSILNFENLKSLQFLYNYSQSSTESSVIFAEDSDVNFRYIQNITFQNNSNDVKSGFNNYDNKAPLFANMMKYSDNGDITFVGNQNYHSMSSHGGAISAKKIDFINNEEVSFENNFCAGGIFASGGAISDGSEGITFKNNQLVNFSGNYGKSNNNSSACSVGGAIEGNGFILLEDNDSIILSQNYVYSEGQYYADRGGAFTFISLIVKDNDELIIDGNYVHHLGRVSAYSESLLTPGYYDSYGGGGALYGGAVLFSGNKKIILQNNYVTSVNSSAYGGVVFSSNTVLINNGMINVLNNSIQSENNSVYGGAFYVSSLILAGNEKVIFAGNLVKGKLDTQFRREAIFQNNLTGESSLSANVGKSVEFYDGNTFVGKVVLNGHDGINDDVTTGGKVLFSGNAYGDIVGAGSGAVSFFRNSLELKGGELAIEGLAYLKVSSGKADVVSTLTLHAGSTLSFGLEDYYENQSYIEADELVTSGLVNVFVHDKDDQVESNRFILITSGSEMNVGVFHLMDDSVSGHLSVEDGSLIFNRRKHETSLFWEGTSGSSGIWNGSRKNLPWLGKESVEDEYFSNRDAVSFRSGVGTITIEGDVSPSEMSFEGGDYVFSGQGRIVGDASLMISGGNLSVSNVNIFTGGVTLTGGKLEVVNASGLGSGDIVMNAGELFLKVGIHNAIQYNNALAKLSMTQYAGELTLNTDWSLEASTWDSGSATIVNNADMTLDFNIQSDKIVKLKSFTNNGILTCLVTGVYVADTVYTLVESGSASFWGMLDLVGWELNKGESLTWQNSETELKVMVTSAPPIPIHSPNLMWMGEDLVWTNDEESRVWININGQQDYFASGDSVTFHQGTGVISVDEVVHPSKVNILGGNYTFSGEGDISGDCIWTISGGHTQVALRSSFTGGVLMTGGSLVIAHDNALGSGDIKISGGNLDMGGYALSNHIEYNYGSVYLAGLENYSGQLTLNATWDQTTLLGLEAGVVNKSTWTIHFDATDSIGQALSSVVNEGVIYFDFSGVFEAKTEYALLLTESESQWNAVNYSGLTVDKDHRFSWIKEDKKLAFVLKEVVVISDPEDSYDLSDLPKDEVISLEGGKVDASSENLAGAELTNELIQGSKGELTTREDQTFILRGNDDLGYSINREGAKGAHLLMEKDSSIQMSGDFYNINGLDVKGSLVLSEKTNVVTTNLFADGKQSLVENKHSLTISEDLSLINESRMINKAHLKVEGDTLVQGKSSLQNTKGSVMELSVDTVVQLKEGSLNNNGEIKGGMINADHVGSVLSGAGTFTHTVVQMNQGSLWNIGNSPGIVTYDGGNATVGNGATLKFSLDGHGTGQYSQIILKGGASLTLESQSQILLSMTEDFALAIMNDEVLGHNFDLIKVLDGSLSGWDQGESKVVLDIDGYDTTGSSFTLSSDGFLTIDKLDLGMSQMDQALISITGNSLWSSTMVMRQFMASAVGNNGSLGDISVGRNSRLWMSYIGGFNAIEDDGPCLGADFQNNGYALGYEQSVVEASSVGIAFGQSFGSVKINKSSLKNEQDALMLALYSHILLEKNEKSDWGITLAFAYGRDDNDMSYQGIQGSWTNESWMLSALLKGRFSITQKTFLTPYLGLEWNYSNSDEFTTSGSSQLRYDSDSLSSLRAKIGVSCAHQFSDCFSGYVDVGVLPDLFRDDPESKVYQRTHSWSTQTTEIGKVGGEVNIGFNYALTAQWGFNIQYSLEMADKLQRQTIRGGVSYQF